ncbi:glycosyltransferase family 4 protein [Flagellimonas sp.]|uniref:glycosyltransferase family 4 protein n=1 Tax=Flagellimonas sp. TaxID=2058762 RepID=UPI003AB299D1
MRIAYISSVFSGLETSLGSGRWSPTGVPTIYKCIEHLDKSDNEVEFHFLGARTSKNTAQTVFGHFRELQIEGLTSRTFLFSDPTFASGFVGKVLLKFTELHKIWASFSRLRIFDPHLVYFDRANVLLGAMFARFTSRKTVLRIMGIYPSMWEILEGKTFYNRLLCWAFSSPFDLVICTEDGTDGSSWVKAALPRAVKCRHLLNGISVGDYDDNPDVASNVVKKDKISILFVGRLEDIKGWREFVKAIQILPCQYKRKLDIQIVGTGTGKEELIDILKDQELSQICHYTERVSHKDMHQLHLNADIYVSMNKLGNLSNANLESYYAGLCSIVPASDPSSGADISTDKIIPDNVLIRIDRDDLARSLSEVLATLIENPNLIASYKKEMKAFAPKFLKSWEERTSQEALLLEEIFKD